jgi:hypothetical protein
MLLSLVVSVQKHHGNTHPAHEANKPGMKEIRRSELFRKIIEGKER